MLHIHNGDSAAGTARKADIPGKHLPWREALVCGPAPTGLSAEDFIKLRAQHLAAAYGANRDQCEQELQAQEETLAQFADHEEVVLWFEDDLFCQVQLLYLLDWFAQRDLGDTKLSLICIEEFPGVVGFRGLGQLSEEQLLSLFPQRQEVSAAQLQIGSKAWRAYSSPDPAELISLINSDLSAIPFLKRALIKHIQRFPSTTNGLGRVENATLDLITKGYGNFRSLFPAFARRESEYGFGDAQLYLELRRLADAPAPLVRSNNSSRGGTKDPAQILLSSFEITELGKAVLSGEQDFVVRNGIDYWLGGVHLQGNESDWRWDEDAKELLVRL